MSVSDQLPGSTSGLPQGITVTGTGRACAPPDVVVLRLAAEASGPAVSGALAAAGAGLSAARDALVAGGVATTDLRTTETALWSDGAQTPRHTARLGLAATVRDLDDAESLLAAALAAAGDTARLVGVGFEHSDPTALEGMARGAAFADALARARDYARLAHRALGPVVAVVEGGARAPVPVARALAVEAAGLPLHGGDQEVAVSVTVTWSWG